MGYFNCKAFNRQNLISMQGHYSMSKQEKKAMKTGFNYLKCSFEF